MVKLISLPEKTFKGKTETLNAPTQRKQMGYLVGALAGGNALSTAIHMAGGILMARMVAPSVLGLFSGIGLIWDMHHSFRSAYPMD